MASREEKIAFIQQKMTQQQDASLPQSPGPTQEPTREQKIDFIKQNMTQPPQQKDASLGERGEAFLQGYGESSTFGYLPEIQAATYPAFEKVGEMLTGQDIPDEPYQQRLRQAEITGEATKAKAPVAAMGGQIAGFIVPGSKVAKGVKAGFKGAKALKGLTGLSKAAAMGVAEGSVMAGLQKAEDLPGKLQNIAYGAVGGGLMGGVGKGFEKAGHALKEHAKALRIKGVGTMLKDFRNIYHRGEVNSLNTFIKEKKILRPGSTVETVVNKVRPMIKKIGKELDDTYKNLKKTLDDSDFIDNLTPKQQDKYYDVGFYPGSSKNEALSYIKSKIKVEEGAEAAISKVGKYLDEMVSEFGDDISIKQANDIKSAVDRVINYSRNPMSPDPIKEKAFYYLRRFIKDKIDDQVKFIDDVVGSADAKKLVKLNKEYGNSATILDISTDRVARDASNRIFGLSEQIATGALGAGSLASGQDKETAALMAGVGFLLSKGAKKYGPGLGAPLMEGLGKAVGGFGRGAMKAAPITGALAASQPKKGEAKWASKGLNSVIESTGDQSFKSLENSKDKEVKRLLMQASGLKKDSKMFKNIVKKLKRKVGK